MYMCFYNSGATHRILPVDVHKVNTSRNNDITGVNQESNMDSSQGLQLLGAAGGPQMSL